MWLIIVVFDKASSAWQINKTNIICYVAVLLLLKSFQKPVEKSLVILQDNLLLAVENSAFSIYFIPSQYFFGISAEETWNFQEIFVELLEYEDHVLSLQCEVIKVNNSSGLWMEGVFVSHDIS